MNKITVKELFETIPDHIAQLFDDVLYPWTVLSRLRGYIESLNKKDFTEISEGVFVGGDVIIHSSATIQAPAIIGSGTEIRPNAYIRGSVITGENCIIGNSSELKNCVLLNNVQIPHYNYVGDSILGNHSHLGAGSICSNLKSGGGNVVIHSDVDLNTSMRKLGAVLGDNADVGCNCVLNPGTIIGKNSRVYPLSSVRGVVPPNCIYKSKDDITKII